MNNLFSQEKKSLEYVYANKFKIKEVDKALENNWEDLEKRSKELIKKFTLPLVVLSFSVALITFIIDMMVELEFSSQQTKRIVTICCSILLVIFLICGIIAIITLRKGKYKELLSSLSEESKILEKQCLESLNIPENAIEVDVLSPYVIVKKDKIVRISRDKALGNNQMYVFIDKNDLCFASYEGIFGVSLFSIKNIEMNKCARVVDKWNKQDKSKEELTKMDVKTFANTYTITKSYSIKTSSINGDFEIIIPSYDIDKVKELVDFK